MRAPGQGWENLFYGAGPEGMILAQFENPALRRYVGRTLADVARERGKSAEETAMDLVVEDGSRVGTGNPQEAEEAMRQHIRTVGYATMMQGFFADMFLEGSDPSVKEQIVNRALSLRELISEVT